MRALLVALALLSAAPAVAQPWSVRLRGVGPVDHGVTVARAHAVVADSLYRVESGSDDEFICGYLEPGDQPGVALMTTDGRIARADVSAAFVRTLSGIGVGSSEAEVRAAYGARITSEPHPYDPNGRYLIYTPADAADARYRLVFETSWGYVTRYRSGLMPAVLWIEGCL